MLRAVVGLSILLALLAFAFGTRHASAGGGCHGQALTTGDGTLVETRGACFEPAVLYVEPGEAVTWRMADKAQHTVTGAMDSWGSYEQLLPGETVTHRFDAAGTYPYVCLLHAGMIGAVVVGDGTEPPPGSVAVEAVSALAVSEEAEASSVPAAGGVDDGDALVLGVLAASATALVAVLTGVVGFVAGRRVR